MGLLEDAIREHLELKRRHGAPDHELERQEVEALGPARREMPAAEPAGEGLGPAHDEGPVEHEAGELEAPSAELPAEEHELPSEDRAEEEPFDEPVSEPAQSGPVAHEPEHEEDRLEPGDEFEQEDLAQRGDEPGDPQGGFESVRHGDTPPRGSEPVEQHEEAESDEDVLEHTPEFLQETPEHDRLWFEQKPPRDFDFD
jgi:hypothetical protein